MLTIDRTTVLKGPCLLINQNQTLYTKSDVTVTPKKGLFSVDTSVFGKNTDQRLKDIYYEVGFVHSGEITAAILGIVLPYASMGTGQSIFGSGTPLQIISLNDVANNVFTFQNAAPSKLPPLALKPDATVFGTMTWACIGQNGAAFNASNRIVAISTKKINGVITGTSNASPDVITASAAHGLAIGDPIFIAGIRGDTAVNGQVFVKTVPSGTTFTVSATLGGAAIAGGGAYVSGGTWQLGAPFNVANIITSPFTGSWATTVPSGTISATSDASPDVVTTTAAHGLVVGDKITIAGVVGDTAVDGVALIGTVPSTTTFTLTDLLGNPIAGNGAYVSGGTFTRSNPLDLFDSEKGYDVTFELSLTTKMSSNMGTYDILFSSLTVRVKGMPIGPAPSDMLKAINAQGANVALGQSMAAEGQNLNLNGNGLYFRLSQAAISTNPTQFSAEKNRIDDVEWVATRSFTNGNPNPLYTISTSPIS